MKKPMKSGKKHEMMESPKERMKEYGSKKAGMGSKTKGSVRKKKMK